MIAKTVKFTDLNGDPTTETWYFHLNKGELLAMEHEVKGGFGAYVERIVEAQDAPALIEEFKKLLLKTVGKKSPDGKRFIKSDEIRAEFLSSEAYGEIFTDLATDEESAAAFVNGIVPNNFVAEQKKKSKKKPTVADSED